MPRRKVVKGEVKMQVSLISYRGISKTLANNAFLVVFCDRDVELLEFLGLQLDVCDPDADVFGALLHCGELVHPARLRGDVRGKIVRREGGPKFVDVVHVVTVGQRACVVVADDGFLELMERVLKDHVEDRAILGVHLIEEERRGKGEDVASKSRCVVGAAKPVAVPVEECILRGSLHEFRYWNGGHL